MPPNPATPETSGALPTAMLTRLIGSLSIVTMIMTIPQVLTIWIGHQAAGVSLLSWSAYFASAVVWFWYGLQKRDKHIYLPCVGWMLLDGAVIIGVVVTR
jgi:uncharacterized protein with PQ loop repeat